LLNCSFRRNSGKTVRNPDTAQQPDGKNFKISGKNGIVKKERILGEK